MTLHSVILFKKQIGSKLRMRRGSIERKKAALEKRGIKGKKRDISIVLVEPQSPGNVGSVARAMRNTGFSDLVLINPCDYTNNDALSMACKADDVLRGARVYPDLKSYVPDAGVLVATTRRIGKVRYPVLRLPEAVAPILDLSAKNRVSILFGREDRGLENDEVAICDILVEIPADTSYGSINLSHAVFIVCYHLFVSEAAGLAAVKTAPREELEKMHAHIESALKALGYGERGERELLEAILRSFRRLFGRTGLMEKEVNMIRGILSQIEKRAAKG